jgi:hypothetical protein
MGADAILYDYLWSQIDKIFAGGAGLRSGVRFKRSSATIRMPSWPWPHCAAWRRPRGTAGGRNGFTFGLLYAREVHIADESRRAAGKLS